MLCTKHIMLNPCVVKAFGKERPVEQKGWAAKLRDISACYFHHRFQRQGRWDSRFCKDAHMLSHVRSLNAVGIMPRVGKLKHMKEPQPKAMQTKPYKVQSDPGLNLVDLTSLCIGVV